MKYLVVLLLGAACIHENSALFGFGRPWARNSLKAKYSPFYFDGFYDLPKSMIYDEGFVKIDDRTAQLQIPGALYCHQNDPRVCVICDKNGRVEGLRISFMKNDVAPVYDFDNDYTYKKTYVFNQPAYSFDVYFTNPETITYAGARERPEVADSVWAYVKGQLVSLPQYDPGVENYNGFQRQACFPQMGQHYFYGVNKTVTDCSQHVNFFGLYHNGEIVGYGIANYGKSSKAENGWDWYENVPLLGAQLILPNRPKCVDDNINLYGLYSLHVYFVETPEQIQCLF